MCCISCRFGGITALVSSLWFASVASSFAATTNSWTNSVGGLWRVDTNWSAVQLPGTSFDFILITNAAGAGTKTVMVDSATDAANLSVRSLTISAPAGSTNTLRLVDVPLGTPLTTSNRLLVGTNGILHIVNSAVSATDAFDIASGALQLDSGRLDCALNCDLQSGRLLVNGGTLTATNGSTGIRMGRFSGANANLTISNGMVNILRLTLGSVSGSQNSLTLAGGTLLCAETFSAAQLPATTGDVTMTGGNLIVTNGTTKIADRATATFAQSGGNTFFTDLRIGDVGLGTFNLSGGQMTVTPRTDVDLTIVGNLENGEFNQSGGVAFIRGELHVADFAGVTGALNLSGGQFFATNDLVAIGRHGFGSLTASNALVVLTNTSVGRHDGAVGTLTLQNDGLLKLVGDMSIGRFTNAMGNVLVTGGQLLITNDTIWVGREGIGQMTISNGTVQAKSVLVAVSTVVPDPQDNNLLITNAPAGTLTLAGGSLQITSNLFLGTSLISTGQVLMTGGNVSIINNSGLAALDVSSGTFTLNGGTLTTDKLRLTNSNGQFVFTGGTLNSKATVVSNSFPFVLGDGTNAATLRMLGGTHSFANGLTISSNATLTGCGTIIGTIVNNGTISTNCGAIPATIISITKTGTTASISFTTVTGQSYTVEYKNTFSDPGWTPLLPALPGTGAVITKNDTSATVPTRIYRVSTQ